MARLAKVVVPGYPRHITQRGNRHLPVFDDCWEMMALFPGLGVFLTGVYSQRRRGERKNCQLKMVSPDFRISPDFIKGLKYLDYIGIFQA